MLLLQNPTAKLLRHPLFLKKSHLLKMKLKKHPLLIFQDKFKIFYLHTAMYSEFISSSTFRKRYERIYITAYILFSCIQFDLQRLNRFSAQIRNALLNFISTLFSNLSQIKIRFRLSSLFRCNNVFRQMNS